MIRTTVVSTLSRSSRGSPAACILCQWRAFSASHVRRDDNKAPIPSKKVEAAATAAAVPDPAVAQQQLHPLANAPRSYGRRTEEFTPVPLSRPIGMPRSPRAGENTGIDTRSLSERRADLVDYGKHLRRRAELKNEILKPYFRDWSNLSFHSGKTFLSPPRLFKADLSLYFPNLSGQTLVKGDKKPRDTTPVLQRSPAGSLVTVFSSAWAEGQVQTFVSKESNPELSELLRQNGDRMQLVQINVEPNALKAWLIRRFMGSLRKRVGRDNWDRYFLVTRGISDEIRESIGLLNSKVGYTYLVDRECRIRWAGSGPSQPDERQSLVKGVQRLLAETEGEARKKKSGSSSEPRRPDAKQT